MWLKGGLASGRWAIFGDFHRQAIFGRGSGDELKENLNAFCSHYVKARLNLNCRNTRNIGEETALLSGFASPPYKMGQIPGLTVDYRYYVSGQDQSVVIGETIRQLLSDGIKAADIVILSCLRFQNSAVSDVRGINDFLIIEADDKISSATPAIRFVTIQAFKGMESPVIILCDIEKVSDGEPQSLLYVAMSRARSQLSMLAHEKIKPSISECVRRKLQEGWRKDL